MMIYLLYMNNINGKFVTSFSNEEDKLEGNKNNQNI